LQEYISITIVIVSVVSLQ